MVPQRHWRLRDRWRWRWGSHTTLTTYSRNVLPALICSSRELVRGTGLFVLVAGGTWLRVVSAPWKQKGREVTCRTNLTSCVHPFCYDRWFKWPTVGLTLYILGICVLIPAHECEMRGDLVFLLIVKYLSYRFCLNSATVYKIGQPYCGIFWGFL